MNDDLYIHSISSVCVCVCVCVVNSEEYCNDAAMNGLPQLHGPDYLSIDYLYCSLDL